MFQISLDWFHCSAWTNDSIMFRIFLPSSGRASGDLIMSEGDPKPFISLLKRKTIQGLRPEPKPWESGKRSCFPFLVAMSGTQVVRLDVTRVVSSGPHFPVPGFPGPSTAIPRGKINTRYVPYVPKCVSWGQCLFIVIAFPSQAHPHILDLAFESYPHTNSLFEVSLHTKEQASSKAEHASNISLVLNLC